MFAKLGTNNPHCRIQDGVPASLSFELNRSSLETGKPIECHRAWGLKASIDDGIKTPAVPFSQRKVELRTEVKGEFELGMTNEHSMIDAGPKEKLDFTFDSEKCFFQCLTSRRNDGLSFLLTLTC
jgi:hypothetical protein